MVKQNVFMYQQGRRDRFQDWMLQGGSAQSQVGKGTPVLESDLQGSSDQ